MPHPTVHLRLIVAASRVLGLMLAVLGSTLSAVSQTLTTAAEVRALTVAQADQGLPVRLRGVIVYAEPGSVFVQDATSTTFFLPGTRLAEIMIGDIVEVEGRTRMGLFMPGLDVSQFRVTGHETVPPGIPVSFDDLASGRLHYRRVVIEGIVRSLSKLNESCTLMRVALGSRVVEARIDRPLAAAPDLVDARVRVAGLAAGNINEQRQLVQCYLCVTDWPDIVVREAAPPLASAALVSAEELLAFHDSSVRERRLRMTGTVSATFPPDTAYLQQGARAFGVRFNSPVTLQPGDEVEVAGFAAMDRYTASVVDADLIGRHAGPPPPSRVVEDPDKLSGIHDGDLVTIRALVREISRTDRGTVLTLQGRTRKIEARLAAGSDAPEVLSEIQLTAICLVETARPGLSPFRSSADVITLRTRSPADLVILRNPSWWTPQRLTQSIAALGLITLGTSLWVALLRRQVRQKTEVLRCRIESEVALRERQRIAREFHDSLNQDLTGLGLRLDAAATRPLDDKGRRILDTARSLLARIQTETRNFVLDLRDDVADDADLVKALEGVASAPVPDGVEVRLEFSGPPAPLAVGTVHHLRMMVRESVANALKHARPTQVKIIVTVEGDLTIRVIDDGLGFDATTETHGKTGHFGCVGVRERAFRLGAAVKWLSAPGKGCTVEIVLPKTTGDTPTPLPAKAPESRIADAISHS